MRPRRQRPLVSRRGFQGVRHGTLDFHAIRIHIDTNPGKTRLRGSGMKITRGEKTFSLCEQLRVTRHRQGNILDQVRLSRPRAIDEMWADLPVAELKRIARSGDKLGDRLDTYLDK